VDRFVTASSSLDPDFSIYENLKEFSKQSRYRYLLISNGKLKIKVEEQFHLWFLWKTKWIILIILYFSFRSALASAWWIQMWLTTRVSSSRNNLLDFLRAKLLWWGWNSRRNGRWSLCFLVDSFEILLWLSRLTGEDILSSCCNSYWFITLDWNNRQ